MYLLLGNSQMESRDYKGAIQSLEQAQAKLGDRADVPPLVVSLVRSIPRPHGVNYSLLLTDFRMAI